MISELKFPCAFERVSLAGVIFRNLTIHNRFKELMILEMKYSSEKSNNSEINYAKCVVRFIQSLPFTWIFVTVLERAWSLIVSKCAFKFIGMTDFWQVPRKSTLPQCFNRQSAVRACIHQFHEILQQYFNYNSRHKRHFFYQQPASKDAENSFVYQAESLTDIVIHWYSLSS